MLIPLGAKGSHSLLSLWLACGGWTLESPVQAKPMLQPTRQASGSWLGQATCSGSGCAVWRPGQGVHSLGGESGSLHQPCPAGSPGEPPRETTREPSPGQGAPLVICCSQAGLVSGDPGAGAMPPREGTRTGSSGNHACGDE